MSWKQSFWPSSRKINNQSTSFVSIFRFRKWRMSSLSSTNIYPYKINTKFSLLTVFFVFFFKYLIRIHCSSLPVLCYSVEEERRRKKEFRQSFFCFEWEMRVWDHGHWIIVWIHLEHHRNSKTKIIYTERWAVLQSFLRVKNRLAL